MTKSTRMLIMDSFNSIERELKVGKRRIKRLYTRALGAGYITLLRPLPAFPEKLFSEKDDPAEITKTPTKSPYEKILLPYFEDIKTKIELEYLPITILEELPIKIPSSSFYRF